MTFSAFDVVRPDSNNVNEWCEISLAANGSCSIKLPKSIEESTKTAWLIVCGDEIRSESLLSFRSYIWSSEMADMCAVQEPGIIISAKPVKELSPEYKLGSSADGTNYIIELSDELAARSYIYVDFREPVRDGGLYVTIDVPAFRKRLINQTG